MGANLKENELVEDEEEYVFLDLSGVCGQTDIPANAPYVLSGLDTLNPVLVIGNKLKLIGEYEETIGTCIVFSETVDPNQASTKAVKPIARLHKTLKFRLLPQDDNQK
ncbi:uncharacterized protein LOC131230272 isoform X1 [Magnolia sinica]|uniref:uncharacterized protein LOC131230272 isoform X1 n=1 Tax=Magnolia sinica TaxID=86752 RepID=UPI002658AB12|nr:uncharacterized protein LOC131230272 isoform X1 [Magnolia sinica]XP_058082091.1 uncharacterized protein LOC131230272 isoform X1 [Magnolia sinica]